MKKWKASVLLTIVLVLTAVLTFLAFASFEVGINDFNGFLGAIQIDYDLGGGRAYTLTLANDNEEDVKDVTEVIGTLSDRLSMLGYNDFRIVAEKNVDKNDKDGDVRNDDIRIELKAPLDKYGEEDVSTLNSDIAAAAAYGELTFYGGTSESPTDKILTDEVAVADASYGGAGDNGGTTYYIINIKFSDYGYKELKSLMGDGTYYLRIDVGENSLTGTTGLALSSSTFTKEYSLSTTAGEAMAKQFALQIKTGGLAYKYDIGSSVKVSSVYGENVISKCIIAMASLIAIIIVAMFLINKGYGLVHFFTSVLALDIFLFLLIAVPNIKMTLGGVIAFAVTWALTAIGYAFTSLKIKEEFAKGKTVKSAVKTAYNRSLAPVLGGYFIILVAAVALIAFTSGVLFNAAVVLAIGTCVAAFADVVLARMFSALLLPIAGFKEKFVGVKRADNIEYEATEEK